MRRPALSELTLRERIGQTAVLRQKFLNNITDLKEYFHRNPYGSIWTMASNKNNNNMENVADEFGDQIDYAADIRNRQFVEHVSTLMKVPFLSAMDAERGCRKVFPFFSETTSNTGIAATGDPSCAYELAKCIAHEIKLAGNLWDWGPVADNSSPFSSSSLTRCFSSDPEIIKAMVTEYIRGVQSEGVAATAKHFPGSDKDEYRDSHFSDGIIRQSMEDWYTRQGCIFEAAIKAGAYSVMIGHKAFPACDDTKINGRYIPATMSKKIITDLLKGRFGFEGVVITDAVGMRSITSMFDNSVDFYASMYNAGNDVILGPIHEDFIDIVEKAVLSGKISEERINDACERVLDLKEKLGLFEKKLFQVTQQDREEAARKTTEISQKYAPRSITWMSRKNQLVPVEKKNIKKVQLIYIGYSNDVLQNLVDFVQPAFEKRGAAVSIVEQVKNEAHMMEIARENDLIVYFAHIAPHSPYGVGGFIQEKATQFLHLLKYGGEKSICVSTASPFVYNDWFPAAENFVNLYCSCPEFLQALVAGIYGECEFEGVCAYNADPLAPRS